MEQIRFDELLAQAERDAKMANYKRAIQAEKEQTQSKKESLVSLFFFLSAAFLIGGLVILFMH